MTVLKLITLLITFHLSQGELNWAECTQKAILLGVKSLGIPSHDPLHIPRNFSSSFPVGSFTATLSITNIIWANIPFWNITRLEQLTGDDDIYSAYEYDIYWKEFVITSNYGVDFGCTHYRGNANLTIDGINWTGRYNLTKSVNGSNPYLNELRVNQTYEHVSANATNDVDVLATFTEHALLGIFQGFAALGNQVNLFGTLFQYAINNNWFNNATKLAALEAWCEAN